MGRTCQSVMFLSALSVSMKSTVTKAASLLSLLFKKARNLLIYKAR